MQNFFHTTKTTSTKFAARRKKESGNLFTLFSNDAAANPPASYNEGGFTILYAVLIVSVILSLGLTIAGIFQREALLTSSSEASTRAFYAADTGLECAMYWDRNQGHFSVSSAAADLPACAEAENINVVSTSIADGYRHRFTLEDSDGAVACADVTIEKTDDGSTGVRTRIESRGYNTCDESDRSAERALRTAY